MRTVKRIFVSLWADQRLSPQLSLAEKIPPVCQPLLEYAEGNLWQFPHTRNLPLRELSVVPIPPSNSVCLTVMAWAWIQIGCVGDLSAINKCSYSSGSFLVEHIILCALWVISTWHIQNMLIVDYRADIHCKFVSKVVPSLAGGANCLQ